MGPLEADSVRFAVIGDSGTGGDSQYETGETMARSREVFPFGFVLMLGDNLYGSEEPEDYVEKFERPYAALLKAGVRFHAALGNHDEPDQRFYAPFNMQGERYYTFTYGNARFFALDSMEMDQAQLDWLRDALSASTERWTIAFMHHPLYSSGERHGSDVGLRRLLEPLFVKYGVNAVFSGHDHLYERIWPQQGIYYFVSGAAGQLRRGGLAPGPLTAAGFDDDRSFMLVELTDDALSFQTITRLGRRVDAGALPHPEARFAPAGASVGQPAIVRRSP